MRQFNPEKLTTFLKVIASSPVSDRSKKSNFPSFNNIAIQHGIYLGFIILLKKILVSSNLMIYRDHTFTWNPAYAEPNKEMAMRLIKDVTKLRASETETRNLIKSNPNKPTNVTIKDMTNEILVNELRERGFEVKCEKHIYI